MDVRIYGASHSSTQRLQSLAQKNAANKCSISTIIFHELARGRKTVKTPRFFANANTLPARKNQEQFDHPQGRFTFLNGG